MRGMGTGFQGLLTTEMERAHFGITNIRPGALKGRMSAEERGSKDLAWEDKQDFETRTMVFSVTADGYQHRRKNPRFVLTCDSLLQKWSNGRCVARVFFVTRISRAPRSI